MDYARVLEGLRAKQLQIVEDFERATTRQEVVEFKVKGLLFNKRVLTLVQEKRIGA